jgi:hypothetical protein
VPDREVAARLAALRRESVDLEKRLRGDIAIASNSAEYWLSQISMWRGLIDRTLSGYPIQQRAIAQVPTTPGDVPDWAERAVEELGDVRAKLDATIERLGE